MLWYLPVALAAILAPVGWNLNKRRMVKRLIWPQGMLRQDIGKLCQRYLATYGVDATVETDAIFDVVIPRKQFVAEIKTIMFACRDATFIPGETLFLDIRETMLRTHRGAFAIIVTPSPIAANILYYSRDYGIPIIQISELKHLAIALATARQSKSINYEGNCSYIASMLSPIQKANDSTPKVLVQEPVLTAVARDPNPMATEVPGYEVKKVSGEVVARSVSTVEVPHNILKGIGQASMRKIVFVGNCQAIAIINVYNQFIKPRLNDQIIFIHVDAERTTFEELHVASADIVVEQVFDKKQIFNIEGIDVRGQVIRFPYLSGRFLWPYGETRHPNNGPIPFREQGPFPAGDTDGYINKMAKDRVEPDAAIRSYLNLDIVKTTKLQRFYEVLMDLQRERDAACGTDFATLIENSFRDNDSFCSSGHPKMPIMRHLLAFVFKRLGVPRDLYEEAIASLSRTPFTLGETPIHPGVAAHFGLKYFDPDRKYLRFTGEKKTFVDFWLDYMKFQWNDDLVRGIARSREMRLSTAELQEVAASLRRGIEHSSGSADAEDALATVLGRLSDFVPAIQAARVASLMEPEHAPFTITLARLLVRNRDVSEAVAVARQAVRLGPGYAESHRVLRDALALARDWEQAAESALELIKRDPTSQHDWRALTDFTIRSGRIADAEALLAKALERFPDGALVWGGLAALRRRQERLDEAVNLARKALAIDAGNFKEYWTLADCLIRLKRAGEAEPVLRLAIHKFPRSEVLFTMLGNICSQDGRLEEAKQLFTCAISLNSNDLVARKNMAALLLGEGEFAEAEALLISYTGLVDNPELCLLLCRVCDLAGRRPDSIYWATKAASAPNSNLQASRFVWDQLIADSALEQAEAFLIERINEGKNLPELTLMLARTYRAMNDIEKGIEAFLKASAAAPSNSAVLRECVDYLIERGCLDQARDLAAHRVEEFPTDPIAHLALGLVYLRLGASGRAREVLEAARQLAPDDSVILRYRRLAGEVVGTD
jgi:tetratricopeptide (TPR) repeat protein